MPKLRPDVYLLVEKLSKPSLSVASEKNAVNWADLFHIYVFAMIAEAFQCNLDLTSIVKSTVALEDLRESPMARRSYFSMRHLA